MPFHSDEAQSAALAPSRGARRPETRKSVSIIAPAYNERDNIRPLVMALDRALGELAWELIVVDDDSPDRTHEVADACAQEGWPVRCIRRLGRRGLSSAVVEGALASSADHLVVMDADLQHDERAIPALLSALAAGADLAVASRHAPGGSLGDWSARRASLSAVATRLCTALLGARVSDPMSGFFALRRGVFLECVYGLSQQGFKILLDIVAASPRELKIAEVPYTFRSREQGESKLDTLVVVEFLLMMVEKASAGLLRPKLMMFLWVGCCGLVWHLAVLRAVQALGAGFVSAQVTATLAAMTLNFAMNNRLTYRAERLKGAALLYGYVVFCAVCSLGAIANVSVASVVMSRDQSWPLAGLAGAVMSAVFNFEVASRLVWGLGQQRRARAARRSHPLGMIPASARSTTLQAS